MPAASLLLDLLFLLETGKHSIQVVLLDPHLGGQLGDRDAGLSSDERQGLGGTGATALATPCAATGCRACGGVWRGGSGCGGASRGGGCLTTLRSPRTTRSTSDWCGRCGGGAGSGSRPTDTCQRLCGGLQPGVLVDQRFELRQSVVYLSALLVKKVSHDCVLFTGVNATRDRVARFDALNSTQVAALLVHLSSSCKRITTCGLPLSSDLQL
jgi:hypothetical protein